MISEIQNIILDFANGDFSKRLHISELFDENDVIASGINMLGEELEEKSISKDYFLNVLNSIPQVIVVFNEKEKIHFINKIAKDHFPDEELIYTYFKDQIKKINLSEEFADKNYVFEIELEKKEDKTVLLCSITKIVHLKTTHFLFVAKDITEEKNENLRILKATMLGQELERKRLAYDLHDSLGQELSALKMNFSALELMRTNSLRFMETLDNIHSMLNSTIQTVRDISFNLIPSKFEDNDLKSCIQQLVNQLNLINNVDISLKMTKKVIQLKDKNDELFLYRVIQEFVNNSIKHSSAKSILIEIKKDTENKKIHFILRDDGIGFDFEKISKINGINNIKQRLKTLNATYSYISCMGFGTKLEFEIYERRN